MGGSCIHPLGRSYSEPSIFHFLPGTTGQQVFIQHLPTLALGPHGHEPLCKAGMVSRPRALAVHTLGLQPLPGSEGAPGDREKEPATTRGFPELVCGRGVGTESACV